MTGRIPITNVQPAVDAGAHPAKAAVGETFEITATVFREGHDAVNANVAQRSPDGRVKRTLMTPNNDGINGWHASVTFDSPGDWEYWVEGWGDPYATWKHNAEIKVAVGMDLDLVFAEAKVVLKQAVTAIPSAVRKDRKVINDAVKVVTDSSADPHTRLAAATSNEVQAVLARYPTREFVTESAHLPARVSRERALFSSWYEFFPRSEGAHPRPDGTMVSGTFAEAAKRLPAIRDMGFDVVYLPPIHPIGTAFRKGPNNTLEPGPGDPGSPWAIGSADGGHDAIHPELGDFDDFDAFVAAAKDNGLEVALDLALQASPDHPWVQDHPEWFTIRVDGTIAYAENPPKKYQDIYPVNFDNDPEGIYPEVLRIVKLWIDHGVTIFRVDNPHTKPVNFWEWLLGEVYKTNPEVIFLAEAFTRPPMMLELAKVGFQQSYSYFTWRNTKAELLEYLPQISGAAGRVMRPNFFVNTPDILHAYLQYGGWPAFRIRAALAATTSPSWGVYSGYELYEHVAVKPGSEEYLDSEKYQYRPRDYEAAAKEGRSLAPYLTMLNQVRQRHRALQELCNLTVHGADDDSVICYSKSAVGRDGLTDTVIVVANVDPHGTRETMVHLDMDALGMQPGDQFTVTDEVTGQTWRWGQRNYVRLDPHYEPAHILSVHRGI